MFAEEKRTPLLEFEGKFGERSNFGVQNRRLAFSFADLKSFEIFDILKIHGL